MLLESLVARGHENRLVLQPGARFAATAERLGVPVDWVRMRNSFDALAWPAIRRLVSRHRPDLVHLACSRAHKLGAVALMGRRHPPKVATRRMDYPLRRGLFSRWLYGHAVDSVVVISDAIGAEIRRVGVPDDRVVCIHDGIEPAELEGLRDHRPIVLARLGWPDDAVVILCAASLRPRKGQAYLVRAFAELAPRHPQARLLLAGDGDQRDVLQGEIAALGLGDLVRLPGQMPREEALGAASIACIPSQLEGLSVFSLESMAAGLPVVASRVGGLPEGVLDGETGLLVAPGDVGGIASALDRFLSDPALGRQMGEAGAARARASFTARRMATDTESLYEQLITAAR